MVLNRRTLLKSFCAGCSLLFAEPSSDLSGVAESGGPMRIGDDHWPLYSVPGDTPEEHRAVLISSADRLGIERLILSQQGYSANVHATAATENPVRP